MISVMEPMFLEHSFIDGVLGIHQVYALLEKQIAEVSEEEHVQSPSGAGIAWSLCGGEIEGLGPGNYLAVSGVPEIIRYLEKIEMGLLRDIEYLELRACHGGCVGGPMTVADQYQARRVIERLCRRYGTERKARIEDIRERFDEGLFSCDPAKVPEISRLKRLSIAEAIERQERIEKILQTLPAKECGACGSPDCRTFAEDVVGNLVSLEECVYIQRSTFAKEP
jgi:hypothetical protein